MSGRGLFELVVVVAAFFLGTRFASEPAPQLEIRVDTIFYERPEPMRTLSEGLVRVNLPKLLFAPSVQTLSEDSVALDVVIERREYIDSAYRAIVKGPKIGGFSPEIESLELYDRHTIRTLRKPSRFAVTAGVGVGMTPKGHIVPHVGVSVGVVLWQW